MRVLFHTYGLAFQSPGGGERVLRELRRSLTELGNEVALYEPWRHDPGKFELRHYFSLLQPESWRHAKARWPGQPLVVTPTSYLGRGLTERLRLAKERVLAGLGAPDHVDLRAFLPLVDLFLPTTSYEAESLHGYLGVPARKIEVVTNGLGAAFLADPGDSFARRIGRRYVLHVGRFHPVKRQDFLIRAMQGVDATLVLIGAPDASYPGYLARCREEADARIPGRCVFVPELAPDSADLASAYAGASVFALPSQFETFGLAALEAVACGCPALLSSGMVAKEVFEGAGEFLPYDDETAWRRRLIARLTEGARVSAPVRARIRESHDWRSIGTRVASLYRKLP